MAFRPSPEDIGKWIAIGIVIWFALVVFIITNKIILDTVF